MRPVELLGPIADAAALFLIGVGGDRRIVWANDRFLSATGYSAADLVGRRVEDLAPWPTDAAGSAASLADCHGASLNMESGLAFDLGLVAGDGRPITVRWRTCPVSGEAWGAAEAILVGVDVTREQAAEARADHLQRALRSTFELGQVAAAATNVQELVAEACERLKALELCSSACVALLDPEGGGLRVCTREHDRFGQDALSALARAESVPCLAAEQSRGGTVFAARDRRCAACPVSSLSRGRPETVLCVRLQHGVHHHGFLIVGQERTGVAGYLERVLLGHLASDLAAAICRIESAQQRDAAQRIADLQSGIVAAILDGGDIGVALLDGDLRLIEANNVFAQLVGCDCAALIGRHLLEECAAPFSREDCERALRTAETVRIRGRHHLSPDHSGGDATFWNVTITPVRARTGAVSLLAVSVTEVSDFVRSREALDAQYRLVEALMETAATGVALVDADLRFIRANEAYAMALGQSVEQLVGHSVLEVFPNADPEPWVRARDLGRPMRFREYPFTFMDQPERGVTYWDWTLSPIPGSSDEGPRLVVTIFEVTDRVVAREALAEQLRLMEAFFTDTLTPLVLLDRDFNFVRVNRAYAEAGGRDVSFYPGRNHFDVYPSDAIEIFKQVRETKQSIEIRARPFVYPDDPAQKVTYWDWVLAPLLDESGEVTHFVFSLRDVTEQKQAQDAVLRYQENLRQLAMRQVMSERQERRQIAQVIHDTLSQTLSFAKLKLDVTRNRAVEPHVREGLAEVREMLDQASDFVSNLTFELSPPILYQLGLVPAIEWLVESMARKHDLLIRLEDDGSPKILPEPVSEMLFAAVRELLTNVVKHAQASTAIVRLRVEARAVRVEVEDDGMGFDLAMMDPTAQKVTSFGTFSVREGIGHIGGQIEFISRPGAGTRVIVTVPIGVDT